ncbi:MAG: hypothetical protein K2X29_04455 [Candidatus Obscuribacterales bacterium]|nr:hypothetical protein [Candidatus Obscuribacterales bacterium]
MKNDIRRVTMRAFLLFLILTFSALPASADSSTSSFTGYLVNKDAVRMANQKIDVKLTQAAYSSKVALQSQNGFAIISNGQLYQLDARGNRLAKLLITDSRYDQPLFVMIRGRLSDGKLVVEQVSDISVQKNIERPYR